MVLQAAEGVYQSAQDVLAKQNKELYPNMLELLAKTTRSVQAADVKEFLNDVRMHFWMRSVLPLMFDKEPAIQQRAIGAMEAVLPLMVVANYEAHPEWAGIKETISGQYCKQLNALRDRHDSNWHRVWALLLRLIQRDILRSATLINRYLSIVELGFRNNNLTVRAEAFVCWKVLVELFARSNELLAPKRIKLVCIPLKSSQSKTEQIAVNKFRVWWYLMTELHDRVVDFTDTIVDPFLLFCFGPLAVQPLIGVAAPKPLLAPGKTYESLMPMVVAALASLLGPLDDFVQRIVSRAELARMSHPFNAFKLFGKIGKSLINSTAEATVLIAKLKDVDAHTPLTTCLWRNLIDNVNELKCYDHFNLLLDNIDALAECSSSNASLAPLVLHIVHQVGTADLFVAHKTNDPDYERMAACVQRIAKMLMHTKIEHNPQCLQQVLDNWFSFDIFAQRGYGVRQLLPRLIQWFPSTVSDEFSPLIRHRIWTMLCKAVVLYADALKEPPQPDVEHLYAFAMLPLTTQLHNFSEFKSDWCVLAEAIVVLNGGGRSTFCTRAVRILEGVGNKPHNDVVACLIDLEDTQFPGTSPPPDTVFKYVDNLCASTGAATTIKDLNVIGIALQTYTKRLDGAQLIRIYDRLKDTFASLESTVMSMRCDQSVCNEFKNIVAHHMRTQKPTQHLVRRLLNEEPLKRELTAMQKPDAAVDFVVIPSVWKFNPDRLTDQQRDKMKERRADIPALYNDTSQSQESRSIKPWTPQKLVLQESNAEPIVIKDDSAPMPTSHSEPSPELPTIIEVDAEPLPLSQGSNSSQGSSVAQYELSSDVKRLARVHNELRKIQIDIIDTEFTVKSRTRSRRSSCNSPIAGTKESRVSRVKNRETESLPLSPRSTKPRRQALADTDASEQHDVDEAARKGSSDLKKALIKIQKEQQRQNEENQPIEEKSIKSTNKLDSDHSDSRALSFESPKTRRGSRAPEPVQTSDIIETTEKRPKRSKKLRSVEEEKSDETMDVDVGVEKKSNDKDTTLNGTHQLPEKKQLQSSTNTSSLSRPKETQPNEDDQQEASKQEELETPMSVDVSTEAIEASQQSPCTSISGRRSIRRSVKPATPTQKPTKRMTTQTMDTLLMDTECAQEVMDIVQAVSPPKSSPPPKQLQQSKPDTQDQAIAEADTEPNTQATLTDSMLNTSTEQPEAKSPSPISDLNDSITEDVNKSILSSPQSTDFEDRNAEFLNDTLNISPIRDTTNSSEPSTPIRQHHQKMDEPAKDEANVPMTIMSPTLQPMVVIAAHSLPLLQQKSMTPLQQRYQAGIMLSSTPTIMSAAPSSSSVTNSPSTAPRYAQFKGRGAQLLNMINSKKKELAKPDCTDPAGPSATNEPTESSLDNSLPLGPPRDLLTFSKTLPSPMASPSFSILKRKFIAEPEHSEDFESPASKRKRVSFHDPPVSSTKEYIGHADEHPDRNTIRPQINAAAGGATTNHQSSPAEQRMRHILRRKSRADSMVEIAKFAKPKMAALPGVFINNSPPESTTLDNTSLDMEPLKWNDTSVHVSPATIINLDELDELITPSSPLHFPDRAAVIQHVVDECPLEDLLVKYPTTANTARLLTRHLTTTMKHDEDVRSATLDQLAENHPLDFLEYAVRSNYSSAVCAKLDPDVMIAHVVQLAKTDDSVRASILGAVTTIAECTDAHNESLHKFQSTVLEQMCTSAKTSQDDEASSARTKLMDAVATVLAADRSDATMTDDQMRLMMQLFNRPMTDNQICECIEMFSRNRKRK